MDLFDDLPPESTNAEKVADEENDGKNAKKDLASESEISENKKEGKERNGEGTEGKRKIEEDVEEKSPIKKIKTNDIITYSWFEAERQGEREEMQDAYALIKDFHEQIPSLHDTVKNVSYFAVFDGHGGARASKFAAENLHKNLIKKFPKGDVTIIEKEIKKVFIAAFKATDEEFLKLAAKNKPAWKDGTTAIVVLAINDTLYVANLGDSKAVLCRYNDNLKKCVAIPLSKDHSPSQYEERIRIQKAKGFVREGRVMGQLEVSRSIGDGPYKNHGVTCIPDMKKCQLSKDDRYVVVACDGLFKNFTNESCIGYINTALEDDSLAAEDESKTSREDLKYNSACSKLANEAVLRLSADNVTVVLVRLNHPKSPV